MMSAEPKGYKKAQHLIIREDSLNFKPVKISSSIAKGNGRGRNLLGVPTANFPADRSRSLLETLKNTGIYFGYGLLHSNPNIIHPLVASLGWNPFFRDTSPTFEANLIGYNGPDFYDDILTVMIVGYLRPDEDYPNLEQLRLAIQRDIGIALEKLNNPKYHSIKNEFFNDEIHE